MTTDAMPPLEEAPPLSPFEFWPRWLFYPPVFAWVLLLMIRHRGVRLPLLANPRFPAGGLVGESKSAILDLPSAAIRGWFARHVALDCTMAPAEADLARALAALDAAGIGFPLVAKPDLGCRGAGVRPLDGMADLADYLAAFPGGARLVLQERIDWEGEAGVLWVRHPGEARGRILSLTLKYFPYVTGDGKRTLRQLIAADPRAGRIAHLYLGRHADRLDQVVPRAERVRLAFAGSHSRGAIFRDGTHLVTPAMEARFEEITGAIPEFWFGRFDVRFPRFGTLADGSCFKVLEVNGAGAEATHIWDSRTRLSAAYASLFRQWSLIFAVGAANAGRGWQPEPFADFLRRWQRERALTPCYPETA
ncbi:MAG: hypothetical protein SNJ63_03760 [Sphingomonadaceae bacterium]